MGLAGNLTNAAPTGLKLPLKSGAVTVPALRQKTVVTPSLLQQAAQLAQQSATQQTNAQVAAIRQQQDIANQQAAQRAAQISAASLAAANFEKPLGDQTQSDYQAALANNTGLAQGYSGQLATDANAEAAKTQAMLSSVPGNTQTAANQGPSLANLLYGLGGQVPGQALNVQGLGATAAARALPLGTLGYGQTEAYGALGAGKSTSDQLQAQILTALGNKPALQNQLLGQYTSAAQSQQSLDNSTREVNSLIADRNASQTLQTTKYNNSLVPVFNPTKTKASGIIMDQFGNPIPDKSGNQQLAPGWHWATVNGQTVQQPDAKPTTPQQQSALARSWTATNHYQSDWQGNPLGGKITPVGGYKLAPDGSGVVKVSTTAGKPPQSAASIATASRDLNTWLKGQLTLNAKPPVSRKNPDPKTVAAVPVQYWDSSTASWQNNPPAAATVPDYNTVLNEAIAQGPDTAQWRQKATQIVQSRPEYAAMGVNGRPWTTAAAKGAAAKGAAASARQGFTFMEALKHGRDANIPDAILLPALAKAYKVKTVNGVTTAAGGGKVQSLGGTGLGIVAAGG